MSHISKLLVNIFCNLTRYQKICVKIHSNPVVKKLNINIEGGEGRVTQNQNNRRIFKDQLIFELFLKSWAPVVISAGKWDTDFFKINFNKKFESNFLINLKILNKRSKKAIFLTLICFHCRVESAHLK